MDVLCRKSIAFLSMNWASKSYTSGHNNIEPIDRDVNKMNGKKTSEGG